MLMKDDYAKTRAISVFDLNNVKPVIDCWSTDESLTFTSTVTVTADYTAYNNECCNVISRPYRSIHRREPFAKISTTLSTRAPIDEGDTKHAAAENLKVFGISLPRLVSRA